MRKFVGVLLIATLLVGVAPTLTHAYGSGGGIITSSGLGGGLRSVPQPIQAFGGQVLGAFTSADPATQTELDALRLRLIGVLNQYVALLQQQLAALGSF